MWSILHSLWDFLEGKMLKVHSLQSMFHLELYNMHERKDALHECLGFSSSVTLCTTENCYILFMFSAFSVLEEVRSKKQSKLIALSFLFFFLLLLVMQMMKPLCVTWSWLNLFHIFWLAVKYWSWNCEIYRWDQFEKKKGNCKYKEKTTTMCLRDICYSSDLISEM